MGGMPLEESRRQRDRDGRREERPAECHRRQRRSLRQLRSEQPAAENGEDRPERGRHQRERQALRQELSYQPGSARSQGVSDRELAPPIEASGQHEVADVAASDEKHERSSGQQDQERRANRANRDFIERHDVHAASGIRVGKGLLETRGHAVELTLRRERRHA